MSAVGRASLWIVLALLALSPERAAAADAPFTAETLSDGVHLFRPAEAEGRTNALVVERRDGLLIVGAQPTASAARELIAAVSARVDGEIRYLLLPHSHAEAAGGVSAFPGSVLVIASQRFDQAVRDEQYDFDGEARRRAATSDAWQPATRPAATLLIDSRVVLADSRNKVEIIPFGGLHSSGDMLVRVGEKEVIYAGALIFPDRAPYAGPDLRDCDIARWTGQLSQLMRQRPERLVPLHGPLVGFEELRRERNALSWLQAQVDDGVADNLPFEEIRERILATETLGEHFDVDSPFLSAFVGKAIDEVIIDREKRKRR
jgi:cyclase